MSTRIYSDAEKAAYWKSKALGAPAPTRTTTRRVATAKPPQRAAVRATPRKVGASRAAAPKSVLTSKSKKEKSFGSKVGSTIGGIIGHGAQQLFTKLTGFGDYTIESNSLFSGGMSPMEIKNTSYNGGVIMRHREYLAPVLATVDFTNTVYPLNPGLSGTFPWVSAPANAFEQWRLRGAIVEYVSTSSDAVLSTNTSSSLGQVMIATQYDSVAPPFSSKVEMLNHEFSNSRKPSVDFVHPIECASSLTAQRIYYVRNGPMPPNTDERLYDLGLLQVATQGMQATGGSVGDIYITYEIEFYKAHVTPTGAAPNTILSAHHQLSGWSSTIPLGNTTTRSSSSSLKGTISSDGRQYNFPPYINQGSFLVTICWRGSTGTTISYPSPGTDHTTDFLTVWKGNSLSTQDSPPQGMPSSTNAQLSFILQIMEENAFFTLSAAGTLPGGTNLPCDMFITQIDSDLVNMMAINSGRRKRKHPKRLLMPGEQIVTVTTPSYHDDVLPKPDEESDTDSEEYVRVKKSDVKRKSLSILSGDSSRNL